MPEHHICHYFYWVNIFCILQDFQDKSTKLLIPVDFMASMLLIS